MLWSKIAKKEVEAAAKEQADAKTASACRGGDEGRIQATGSACCQLKPAEDTQIIFPSQFISFSLCL